MPIDDRVKDELDALEALVVSDGWQQLKTYVQREWGNDNLATRCLSLSAEPNELQLQLAEFLAGRRAALLVLQWPLLQIRDIRQRLEAAPPERGASRMG